MTKNQDGGTQSNRQQETVIDSDVEPLIEVTPVERILIPSRISRNSRR
jgi:hypothetical protein